MNIQGFGKKGAQVCACALMLSILFLPVHAAETVPIPFLKPSAAKTVLLPIPKAKPKHVENVSFQALSLNLASLFFLSDNKTNKRSAHYPHGYKPLSGEQAALYMQIFEMQALGKMESADRLIKELTDKRLVGHVLYQRYMHPSYVSSFKELKNWMAVYADHPGADKVYKLAQVKGSDRINEPKTGPLLARVNEPTIYYPKHYKSVTKRSTDQQKSVRDLSRKVRAFVRTGEPSNAQLYMQSAEGVAFIDEVEYDGLIAQIAAGYLYAKDFQSAYGLAVQAADRSGRFVPEAAWVAGLALWQQDSFEAAAPYFEMVGQSAYASGWLASAGYYWAARSHKKSGNEGAATKALERAAKHSRTFYGLLAAHSLGTLPSFHWDVSEYTADHEALILSYPAGKRVFTLVAAEQYDLAEEELMRLDYKGNIDLSRAVLAYASHVGLPGVALRLGNMIEHKTGQYYDSALYPVSPWSPQDGYKLDPALVHAVIRQESRFDQNAQSYSGALGLMQIMPKTAQYIANNTGYKGGLSAQTLKLPEVNMKIGQDYLDYLLKGQYVKGDVVSLLVAYNAGPGNLLKWKERIGEQADPLLFVEMVPIQETRDYVERVMSNYWIYRMRAGLEVPSLGALSKGRSPQYAHVMQAEYPYKLAAHQ